MPKPTLSIFRVFGTFLRLGSTCFGGPAAHIAIFHRTFVEKFRWISENDFAEWLSLCQSLPGPSSSQLGICLGRHLGGLPGAFAAWLGFTLPGAVALSVLGYLLPKLPGLADATHGLEVFAVSVVAHAVWTMAKSLCPDLPRRGVGILGALVCWAAPGAWGQILAILVGAGLGRFLPRKALGDFAPVPQGSMRQGWVFLAWFAAVSLGLQVAIWGWGGPAWLLAGGLFQSGALVFGGGHVVLPLLHERVVVPVGIADATFLLGYGLAQVMPGPLFNVSGFLGAVSGVMAGPLIAVVCIFLPGALLLLGVLPFWERLRMRSWFVAAIPGVNAAVVGILFATLAGPVRAAGIGSVGDLLLASGGFATLAWTRIPVWILAVAMAAVGWLLLP